MITNTRHSCTCCKTCMLSVNHAALRWNKDRATRNFRTFITFSKMDTYLPLEDKNKRENQHAKRIILQLTTDTYIRKQNLLVYSESSRTTTIGYEVWMAWNSKEKLHSLTDRLRKGISKKQENLQTLF